MKWQSWPVESDVHVRSLGEAPPYAPEIEKRVDLLWKAELDLHPSMFDGRLLVFVERHENRLAGRFIPYRYYVAQRRDPELARHLALVPMGVSGLLLCADAVAFARRGSDVTQYPGHLELMPSGGINDASLRPDGSVDYRHQLLEELAEETGIGPESVQAINPLAVVRNYEDEDLDVGAVIEVAPAARAVVDERLTRPGEYRELRWVRREELPAFVREYGQTLVPTSIALVEAFLGISGQQAGAR